MLVDVVVMRIQGEPRPKAEVHSATPVRGILQLDFVRPPGWHPRRGSVPLLAGLVVPGGSDWVLPPLDEARIERIRGPNLFIVGIEETIRGRQTHAHRQAWWCRLVPDVGATAVVKPASRSEATSGRPPGRLLALE